MVYFKTTEEKEKFGTHFEVVFGFGINEAMANLYSAQQRRLGLISEVREVSN